MLEEGIFTEIKNDATIAAKLLDSGSVYRIYPLRVPNGELPSACLTYTEISQSLTYPLVRSSVFQISCIAATYEGARGLAEDINRIFNDFSEGMLGGVFPVKYVKFQGRSSMYDESSKLYIFPVELFIKY